MQDLTPVEIVDRLDAYIIGQEPAKRAVAVAIRNRWRRRQLSDDIAREIYPKNIVMIGPTGVGKTEIARRLAKLTGAPFIKVEASKFTEVGYHGRDVESMIRDLLEQAIGMVRAEQVEHVAERAREVAEQRLVDLLLPGSDKLPATPTPGKPYDDPARTDGGGTVRGESGRSGGGGGGGGGGWVEGEDSRKRRQRLRDRMREQLNTGKLDDREVEIDISSKASASMMFANMGLDQMDPDMAGMLEKLMPEQSKRRRVTVADARQILIEQETDKLLDTEKITAEAIDRTQDDGIIFLDEIDKVASPSGKGDGRGGSPDVSRQGVQRDLLPIVEGSAVNTRHGVVHTDHILFIAAGAFHSAAVSDLMPELQGRFPIRVELSSLGRDEFVRILTEPDNALTRQQEALLGVEGLEVSFADGAVEAIAELAAEANASMENIGARRLMTIVEKVFDEVTFDAPQRVARGERTFEVTAAFVREQVAPIVRNADLSKFVL
ncbi:MAG: ATP-dependent protease ATPase subunit HslU [Phycisphaeraceae bacterium]